MKFKGKPFKIGNSWAITIPADFIQHGYIKTDRVCHVELKEVNDDGQENGDSD